MEKQNESGDQNFYTPPSDFFQAGYQQPTVAPVVQTGPVTATTPVDLNPLMAYYKQVWNPEDEKKKEKAMKAAAITGSIGNILRSFLDIGVANKTGYPVTGAPRQNRLLNNYYALIQENQARQDKMNQYMLSQAAQQLAQNQQFTQQKDMQKGAQDFQGQQTDKTLAHQEKAQAAGFGHEETMQKGQQAFVSSQTDEQQVFQRQLAKMQEEERMKQIGAQGANAINETRVTGEETRKTNAELYPNGKPVPGASTSRAYKDFMTLNDRTSGKQLTTINGLQADAIVNQLNTEGILAPELSVMIKNLKGLPMPDDQQKRIIAEYYGKLKPEVLKNILERNVGADATTTPTTSADDPLNYGIK